MFACSFFFGDSAVKKQPILLQTLVTSPQREREGEAEETEKIVEVPTISLSESLVEVPVTLVHEKVVEVPEVQVVEVMKQHPKLEYQETFGWMDLWWT